MFRALLLFLNILVACLLAATYITPYLDPLTIRKLPLIGLLYPSLLIINILFILWWGFFSKKAYIFISIVVILLGIKHATTLIGIPILQTAIPTTAGATKIGTYNIKDFDFISLKGNTYQPAAIKKLNAYFGQLDYLCIQETNYEANQLIKQQLQFPYFHGEKSTRVFSRTPFLNKGVIDFGDTDNSCAWVDVPFEGQTVRLYSLHLESNHITPASERMVQPKSMRLKDRYHLLKYILQQYAHRNRVRVEQTTKVLAHVQNSPYPVVICGDFNDSPLSYIYRKFTHQLTDGFVERGTGLGISFRGKIPFLRIDYILADSRLSFQEYQTIKALTYSDHYPIMARIGVE